MSLLDIAAFENTPLQHEPFDYLIARQVLSAEALAQINRDYPDIEVPANFVARDLRHGPAFRALLDELEGHAFQAAVARKFDIDLQHSEKTITVRRYSEPSDGHIHTDHWSKLITVLMYFNPEWTQAGGRLRLLRNRHDIEDYAAEAEPVGGTLLAFRRSNRSFHGYKRFSGERRVLQVNWVRADPMARYAQQLARFSTHTGKRLLRMVRGAH